MTDSKIFPRVDKLLLIKFRTYHVFLIYSYFQNLDIAGKASNLSPSLIVHERVRESHLLETLYTFFEDTSIMLRDRSSKIYASTLSHNEEHDYISKVFVKTDYITAYFSLSLSSP